MFLLTTLQLNAFEGDTKPCPDMLQKSEKCSCTKKAGSYIILIINVSLSFTKNIF
jgi:hypothetical protein